MSDMTVTISRGSQNRAATYWPVHPRSIYSAYRKRRRPYHERTIIALAGRERSFAGLASEAGTTSRSREGTLISTSLARIAVGVAIERRKAKSAWADFLWRPVSVFAGEPTAKPWTPIGGEGEVTLFYAGDAVIELHRTETTNYRENLTSGSPTLWVNLRPTGSEPPYELLAVTADPAEGEAFTDAGSNLVEAVPMPPGISEIVGRFVAEHHVERPFVKRQRNR